MSALGLFFVLGQNNTDESTSPQEKNEGSIFVLPDKLNIKFAEEIPTPNNPCYSLEVEQHIKENRAEFSQITESETHAGEIILQKYNPPLEINRGSTENMQVALTIDTGTGGSYGIDEILQIARHYDVYLTFFLTGCWVLENPELTQKIFTEGHSIGNHSLTHRNLADASDEAVMREITETERILQETLGIKSPFFRKPHYAGGERITNMLGELGYISVQGYPDFGDTGGWRSSSTSQEVLNNIKQKTAPGAIWVLHNLSPSDLGSFEDIVRFHLEEGYKLIGVEKLLP